MTEAPEYPAGEYQPPTSASEADRQRWIAEIAQLHGQLRSLVSHLNQKQLDTVYRQWTVRQIVHHLADSHINAYTRFKLGMTENHPTIKPYDESAWSSLEEAKTSDILWSLNLLEALHARWVALLKSMSTGDFQRTVFHPQRNQTLSLLELLSLYAHHGRHHTAQIAWLSKQHGWKTEPRNA